MVFNVVEAKKQKEQEAQLTSTTIYDTPTTATDAETPTTTTAAKWTAAASGINSVVTPHIPSYNSETVNAKLLEEIVTNIPKASDPTIVGNRIIDVSLLGKTLSALCCPYCYKDGLKENL